MNYKQCFEKNPKKNHPIRLNIAYYIAQLEVHHGLCSRCQEPLPDLTRGLLHDHHLHINKFTHTPAIPDPQMRPNESCTAERVPRPDRASGSPSWPGRPKLTRASKAVAVREPQGTGSHPCMGCRSSCQLLSGATGLLRVDPGKKP